MNKRKALRLVIGFLCCFLLGGIALAISSDNYRIDWGVIAGGGGRASSASHTMRSTVGQTAIGPSSSANFQLGAGYLYGVGVEKAVPDVEEITVGDGTLCFSFAIFADPQSDTTSLASAVSEINGRISTDNIRFVIVAGDLVQGEEGLPNDYQGQFNAIKAELAGLNVPYIPMLGNHDVWCNLYTTPIPIPGGGSIPRYTGPPYPEGIFDTVFGPVYTSLANTLAGWSEQEGMPLTNPIAGYPPTYFQNFAFDYGDYHFVYLDYSARDDFKPSDWTIMINNFPIPVSKFQFGYARIQNEYGNDGTIKWFEDHLEKYGYCDPDRYDRGYKRSKNMILLSHHAPVFNLKGTGTYNSYPVSWALQDENTYGFNETEYNDLVSLLNSLRSNHDFNYQWFTGHYHVKNWEWTDTQITPPAGVPVKVIASVQPLSWARLSPGIVISPVVTINNAYPVTTADNNNGQITIVKVLQLGGTAPDPSIYNPERHAQHSEEWPLPVVWDNPDIELYDQSGSFVPSGNLDYGQKYEIRARIYNRGCSDATINVRFTWGKEALSYADTQTGFSGGNVVGPITIPSGKEEVVSIRYWDTSVVGTYSAGAVVHACVSAIIEPISNDFNSHNNRGQENCDVHNCKTAASNEVIEFSFPIENPTEITNGITVDVSPEEGRLWTPSIILPELPPYGEGNVTLRLYPILGVVRNVGDSEIFSLTARRLDTGETTGGLDVKVVVDDPPTLDWTGDIGYQTDGVEPDEGNAGTIFSFRVSYKDENNHAPASGYPLLYLFKGDEQIQGSPFIMNEEDPTDIDHTDGKIYRYSVTLSEPGDDYTYWFWARDSLGIEAKGPAVDVMSGPLVKLPIKIYLPLTMKNYPILVQPKP